VSVRQIPPNRRSVTGKWPSAKTGLSHGFESTLERDLMALLDFDPNVDAFHEQPVRIDYLGENGEPRWTIPDVLAIYRRDRKPTLFEVKYAADLFANWKVLHPKLRAASRYARQQGWDFRVITESEIRTTYLQNVKMLLPYRRCAQDVAESELLLTRLREYGELRIDELLAAIYHSKEKRSQLCASLYKLLSSFDIGIDLDEPITNTSLLWTIFP